MINKYRKGAKTPELIALLRSRTNKEPNSDFNNSWDLGILGKIKGWLGKGSTCTNTATSFYYPDRPTAGSSNLLATPDKAGFKIVSLSLAVPGGLIVISNPDNTERHTVVFDKVYRGKPYMDKRFGVIVEDGDTLVNYANGKRGPGNYRTSVAMNKVFPKRIKHTYLKSK